MSQDTAYTIPTLHSSHQSQDFPHTFKMNSPHPDMIPNINPSNESALQLENQLLQDQIKKLTHTILQYQFTNQRVLETLHENILLHDNITTLDLKINCLSQAVEIQSLELCRRDNLVADYTKDVANHEMRFDILSQVFKENGTPSCKSCSRHPPLITKCKKHPEEDQIVGCIFCTSKRCPKCKSRDLEHVSIQPESKKIKKIPKAKAPTKSNKKN